MRFAAVSLLLPVSITLLTQFVISPILDRELETCSERKKLKRSLKAFIISASFASFLSLMMGLGIEINMVRLQKKYHNDISKVMNASKQVLYMATMVKLCILTTIMVSASIAVRAYKQCS
jgi:hypothetical protein